MKNNPRTLNTDYDKWLRGLRVEQLKKFYRTFQAILGQCNDDIDVVRGKIFKLCEVMGEDVHSFMEKVITMNYMELNKRKVYYECIIKSN